MSLRHLWDLDPSVTFLNHGSFGATPRAVRLDQRRWQDAMEAQPVDFLVRRLPELLAASRAWLGAFLGADPAGLALVPNATTGVNTALRSLDWQAGDEVVIADHGYNAVIQALRWLSDRHGVRTRLARVPFPLDDAAQITAAFADAIGPRTRLLIIDHITSATALIFPVAEILALARQAGALTLVDGAHAPGMLPLSLDALGADFYTGNLHKWPCAPKGCAFLYVRPERRERVHPLAISHAYRQGFLLEADWTGTADPSPFLSIPATLDFWEAPGSPTGGWAVTRAANHALVQTGRREIARALGADLPHPDDPALYGAMAAVPFDMTPDPGGFPGAAARAAALNTRLYADHRIEVPFTAFDDRIWLRISGQRHNAPEEYARLAEVLAGGWRGGSRG